MSTLKKNLVTFLFLLLVYYSHGQSVGDIISKHNIAVGGIEKWNNLYSMETNTKHFPNDGSPTPTDSKEVIIFGEGVFVEANYDYGKTISVNTKSEHWIQFTKKGERDLSGGNITDIPKEYHKYYDSFEGGISVMLYNYFKKGGDIKFISNKEINGESTYEVKVVEPEKGKTTFLYFSTTTYYILKTIVEFEDKNLGRFEENYSDFKPVEGLVFAHKISNARSTNKIVSIVLDPRVDASIFKKPTK